MPASESLLSSVVHVALDPPLVLGDGSMEARLEASTEPREATSLGQNTLQIGFGFRDQQISSFRACPSLVRPRPRCVLGQDMYDRKAPRSAPDARAGEFYAVQPVPVGYTVSNYAAFFHVLRLLESRVSLVWCRCSPATRSLSFFSPLSTKLVIFRFERDGGERV